MKVARVIYQELGIGAVAITDRDKLLAFIGIGDDHHLPGTPIASVHSHRAIDNNEVVYADGNQLSYCCSINPACKLGSTLVIRCAAKPAGDRHHQTVRTEKPAVQHHQSYAGRRHRQPAVGADHGRTVRAPQAAAGTVGDQAAACAGQSAFPVQCPEYRWR